MLHVTDNLLEGLAAAVGERHVLVDDDVRAPFEVDWTGRYRGVRARRRAPRRRPAGGRGRSPPAASTARPSSRRAATPAWSAPASRAAARWSSARRASPSSGRSIAPPRRSRPAPGSRSPRVQEQRTRGGPRCRRRLRRARQRHRRRPRRHQRRRDPRHALRDGPRPRRGAAGGPGRRLDHRAPDPAQGQRRLRPVGPARRQRGHARRSSPPSAGGWCPGSPAAWRR